MAEVKQKKKDFGLYDIVEFDIIQKFFPKRKKENFNVSISTEE